MGKVIDITGQKFGKLLVLERAENKNNRAMWLCKCDCGVEIIAEGTKLRLGRKLDCGCVQKEKRDLTNQKFGKLTALYPTDKRTENGSVIWHCKCDCGNEVDISANSLKKGNSQSCGCVRIQKLIEYNHTKALDVKNQKFGKLTALYPTDKRSNEKSIIWHCQCDCGNEVDIPVKDLVSGNTKSCGCQRYKFYGELKIKQILENNEIQYIKEYQVEGLTFKGRYDFFLPEYNVLIEYDGIQHFKQGNGKYDNKEKFQITQRHDAEKNKWSKENKIPLIRIPYTHYDKIQLEDLLPETSHFLI